MTSDTCWSCGCLAPRLRRGPGTPPRPPMRSLQTAAVQRSFTFPIQKHSVINCVLRLKLRLIPACVVGPFLDPPECEQLEPKICDFFCGRVQPGVESGGWFTADTLVPRVLWVSVISDSRCRLFQSGLRWASGARTIDPPPPLPLPESNPDFCVFRPNTNVPFTFDCDRFPRDLLVTFDPFFRA